MVYIAVSGESGAPPLANDPQDIRKIGISTVLITGTERSRL
jgi:hypothetical protein